MSTRKELPIFDITKKTHKFLGIYFSEIFKFSLIPFCCLYLFVMYFFLYEAYRADSAISFIFTYHFVIKAVIGFLFLVIPLAIIFSVHRLIILNESQESVLPTSYIKREFFILCTVWFALLGIIYALHQILPGDYLFPVNRMDPVSALMLNYILPTFVVVASIYITIKLSLSFPIVAASDRKEISEKGYVCSLLLSMKQSVFQTRKVFWHIPAIVILANVPTMILFSFGGICSGRVVRQSDLELLFACTSLTTLPLFLMIVLTTASLSYIYLWFKENGIATSHEQV